MFLNGIRGPGNGTGPADDDHPPATDTLSSVHKYIITFTHPKFSKDRVAGRGVDKSDIAVIHRLVCLSSTAFWDAYLKGRPDSLTWLAQGGLTALLGKNGNAGTR